MKKKKLSDIQNKSMYKLIEKLRTKYIFENFKILILHNIEFIKSF